jgi:hypothetical protein
MNKWKICNEVTLYVYCQQQTKLVLTWINENLLSPFTNPKNDVKY